MRRWIVGFSFPLLFVSCATSQQPVQINQLKANIEVVKLRQDRLLKEVDSLNKRLAELREEVLKLKVTNNDLSSDVEKVKRKLYSFKVALKNQEKAVSRVKDFAEKKTSNLKVELNLEVSNLRKRLISLERQVKKEREILNKRLAELESKINTLEEKLSNLRIPSIKIEKVNPGK